MSQSGHSIRKRAHGQRRPTRPGHVDGRFEAGVAGMPYSEARDGEQSQGGDLAPNLIVTDHFDPEAAAPQVNNNPTLPAEAEVVIDETGLTILNGKLFLYDYGGNSVLGAAGFGGSWTDFVVSHLYNAAFGFGTTDPVATTTEVSGASTEADYAASLSTDLPYWIVVRSGAGTVGRVADATASGGAALKLEGVVTATVYQDAPIVSGYRYSLEHFRRWSYTVGTMLQEITYSWRDADHAIIGSSATLLSSAGLGVLTRATYARDATIFTDAAPVNARYLRVEAEYTSSNAGNTLYVDRLRLIPGSVGASMHESAQMNIHAEAGGAEALKIGVDGDDVTVPRLRVRGAGVLEWGSGSAAPDVLLERSEAGTLRLEDGDRWDAPYCGTGISRVTAIAVTTSTHSTLTYPTTFLDAQGGTWTVTSSHTITIPHDGLYDVDVRVEWGSGAGSTRRIVGIGIDGDTVAAQVNRNEVLSTGATGQGQQYRGKHYFTAGQTVKSIVWHNHGSDMNVTNARFSIIRVGR